MYKALYDYARAYNLEKNTNRSPFSIEAYICVDKEGNYLRTEFPEPNPKTKKIDKKYVPSRTKGGQGVALWGEVKPVILYNTVHDLIKENELAKYKTKSLEWRNEINKASEELDEIHIIKMFIDKVDADKDLAKKVSDDIGVLKDKATISFKIIESGIYDDTVTLLEESNPLIEYCDKENELRLSKTRNTKTAVSIISGKEVEIVGNTFPVVSALRAPLASFKYDAFTSYGLEKNMNAPMSDVEANTIAEAVERLLNSEHNHNATFNILYWYNNADAIDILSYLFKDEISEENKNAKAKKKKSIKKLNEAKSVEDDYTALYDSVFKKTDLKNHKNTSLYMMNYYSPSTGRMRLLNGKNIKYEDLYNAFIKWNQDTTLLRPVYTKDEGENTVVNYFPRGMTSISPYLYMFVAGNPNNLYEAIKKQYGSNLDGLLNAVINGRQIPVFFYKHALEFVNKYMINANKLAGGDEFRKYTRKRYYQALALIKAYLIREGSEVNKMCVELDVGMNNVAYQCGRWFATIVQLQKESTDKNIDGDIASKYYRVVKRAPGIMLSKVNDLKPVYLKRLESVSKKHRSPSTFEAIFAEIGEKIGEIFPKSFNSYEQGAFDLGYCHQINSFYQKKSGTEKLENNNVKIGE